MKSYNHRPQLKSYFCLILPFTMRAWLRPTSFLSVILGWCFVGLLMPGMQLSSAQTRWRLPCSSLSFVSTFLTNSLQNREVLLGRLARSSSIHQACGAPGVQKGREPHRPRCGFGACSVFVGQCSPLVRAEWSICETQSQCKNGNVGLSETLSCWEPRARSSCILAKAEYVMWSS